MIQSLACLADDNLIYLLKYPVPISVTADSYPVALVAATTITAGVAPVTMAVAITLITAIGMTLHAYKDKT